MARSPGFIRWPTYWACATFKNRKNGNHGNERPPSRARAPRPERLESEKSVYRLEGSRPHGAGDRGSKTGRPQAEVARFYLRYRVHVRAAARAAHARSDADRI